MTTPDLPILAALPTPVADAEWSKLVGVAVVVVIWLVGAAAEWVKKLSKPPANAGVPAMPPVPAPTPIPSQYPAPPPYQPMPPPIPSAYAPGRPPATARRAGPPAVRPATGGRKVIGQKKAKPSSRAPALVPAFASDRPSTPVPAAAAPARRPAVARAATPLDAAGIRRWLTPQTLRRQYVLTELFDRPPSDR